MSERKRISDEIRDDFVRGDGVDAASYYKLLDIANRIDREMVELPRDRDGVPIRVGDTVYLDDGRTAKVTRIGIGVDEDSMCVIVYGDGFPLTPGHLTHSRPDSWERIADELDGMVGAADHPSDTYERLADLAERIRKLAEKEAE